MDKGPKSASPSQGTKDKPEIDCFVIMPIADPDGYPAGHFKHVYDDIICPSCAMEGINPIRADDVKATNMIHLDILQKLIDAPIAICDLSSRNPNVLFELGIRQAFDKPVVLIQEEKTPRIFDISPLRYLEYSREMKYHEVLSTHRKLADAIRETLSQSSSGNSINSIVKLLALGESAKIPDLKGDRDSVALDVLMSEMNQMRRFIESFVRANKNDDRRDPLFATEYERLSSQLDKVQSNSRIPPAARLETMYEIFEQTEKMGRIAESRREHEMFKILLERAHGVQMKLMKEVEGAPF